MLRDGLTCSNIWFFRLEGNDHLVLCYGDVATDVGGSMSRWSAEQAATEGRVYLYEYLSNGW